MQGCGVRVGARESMLAASFQMRAGWGNKLAVQQVSSTLLLF
jgi:hypothetical protein